MFRLHRCFNQDGHVTQLYISKQGLELPLRATWPNIWGTNNMFAKSNTRTDRKESPWCQEDTRDEKPSARPPECYTPEKDGEQRFSHPTTLSQFSLRPRTTQVEKQQLFESVHLTSGRQKHGQQLEQIKEKAPLMQGTRPKTGIETNKS